MIDEKSYDAQNRKTVEYLLKITGVIIHCDEIKQKQIKKYTAWPIQINTHYTAILCYIFYQSSYSDEIL